MELNVLINVIRNYMFKLYKHQQEVIDKDPKVTGIWFGTGTGKTALSLSLAKGNTLVVCPKTVRDARTWENQLQKIGIHNIPFLKVISKEEFKRDNESLPKFDTLIIDESHTICGLTANIRYKNRQAIPKSSQLFEAFQNYISRTKPERLYLCTATPVKNPMAVLAAAWLLGKTWNFYNWRETFMFKLPMPGRMEVWSAKKDNETKDRLAKAVKSLGFTGRISDFTDVPEQTHIVKHIPLTKQQEIALRELPMTYPDPITLCGKKHQVEQGVLSGNEFEDSKTFETGKIEAILDICDQYEKVLIFSRYTAQIGLIEKALKKEGIDTYILTGKTKDRGTLIKDAEENNRCAVIIQSQISAGYELPSFRCTIFASQDYSFVNHEQSIGRNLRMNAIAPNLYVYLISGDIDKGIRNALLDKKDFSERVFCKI